MDFPPTRSEQVVQAYKRHKLAVSALKKIHQLIIGFEQGERFDFHIARVGLVISLLLIATISIYFFNRPETVIIP